MVVRESFENSLNQLQEKMAEMGRQTEAMMEKSFQALKNQDIELALRVIEDDNEVDVLEEEIDQLAIWLIVREQPVARDLRQIVGALRISSEIERVADYAVNISKSTIKIGKVNSLIDIKKLETMKNHCITMLRNALDAFFNEDIVLAKEAGDMDDMVDELSDTVYKELTKYLKDHCDDTIHAVELLFVNRHLERMADHITNIAESAAYLIKGKKYDLNPPNIS